MKEKGNDIFSKEEELMAQFLKEKNLMHANQIATEVHPKNTFYTRYGKRVLDLIIITPVIVFLSPIYLILALLNLINMGTPIFYKQTRYGYRGKYYDIYKFRSMKNLYTNDGRQLSPDHRLTKYGKLIRKLSLDELPNLINIFRGEMSIIGPRGVPVFYMERMTERHKMMSAVRPGLECPRVISFEDKEDMSVYHINFENNIWYVENVSLMTDVRMIFLLIKLVFSYRERSHHASGASFFVGYDDKGRAISMSLAKNIYDEQCQKWSRKVG